MRDEVQEQVDEFDRKVSEARVYAREHGHALVAVVVGLVVAEVVAVVALDGFWMQVATAVILAQAVAAFLFVGSVGDGDL